MSHIKVKTSDPADLYNQVSNSRAAVFESFLIEARERLAKQDARARTRSSSGAFARECAEQLIENRELYTAARRCGGTGGFPPVLLFFCRHFLFQIKRKCRNAGSVYHLIMVCSEGRVQILQFHIVPLTRHRCVEVAAPYKFYVNNFAQTSRSDDICPYHTRFTYYFERSETPLSLVLRRASPPLHGCLNRFCDKSQFNYLNFLLRHHSAQFSVL